MIEEVKFNRYDFNTYFKRDLLNKVELNFLLDKCGININEIFHHIYTFDILLVMKEDYNTLYNLVKNYNARAQYDKIVLEEGDWGHDMNQRELRESRQLFIVRDIDKNDVYTGEPYFIPSKGKTWMELFECAAENMEKVLKIIDEKLYLNEKFITLFQEQYNFKGDLIEFAQICFDIKRNHESFAKFSKKITEKIKYCKKQEINSKTIESYLKKFSNGDLLSNSDYDDYNLKKETIKNIIYN